MKWTILSIRDVPPNFDEKVVGLVTFSYEPDETDGPLVLTRWSDKAKKEFESGRVVGATCVLINDAQLCEKDKSGKFYLLTNPFRVPDAIRFAVADEGKRRWLEMTGTATPATTTKPDAPTGGWGKQNQSSLRPAPTGTTGA